MRRPALLWTLLSLAVAGLLIATWQQVADARLVSSVFLPGPDRAFAALWRGLSKGDLLAGLLATLQRMALGWLLASLLGIGLGALIGSSARARAYLAPMLEFLRPLPASAVIPVAIALLGLSDAMVLAVIGFGALWPMLLATIHGLGQAEPRLLEVARLLGMGRLQVLVKITLPGALPDILSGLRLGLTIALILAVVGEMLASREGLGQAILLAARSFRSADLFAGVILLGAVGYLSALALGSVERRLLRWRATA